MISETQAAAKTRTATPAFLRARMLLVVGWTLLILSIVLLAFHMLWMWHRMGTSAPIVAAGISLDALVGLGLIIAGTRTRKNLHKKDSANYG